LTKGFWRTRGGSKRLAAREKSATRERTVPAAEFGVFVSIGFLLRSQARISALPRAINCRTGRNSKEVTAKISAASYTVAIRLNNRARLLGHTRHS
jgi:hypothetical protein